MDPNLKQPQGCFFLFPGLLRAAIEALEFCARRSRTGLYCSRHRAKFRLALAALATAREQKIFLVVKKLRRSSTWK